MHLSKDAQARTGSGCLYVTGLQPGNSWSYASTPNIPLLPGSRYRLSGWMKVDGLPQGAHAPYLKVGMSGSDGKWQANANTNPYDISAMGTWQRLTAIAETGEDTVGGNITIEKGAYGQSVPVTLRIDDISLELLETP
jgi:hypothetical protein